MAKGVRRSGVRSGSKLPKNKARKELLTGKRRDLHASGKGKRNRAVRRFF